MLCSVGRHRLVDLLDLYLLQVQYFLEDQYLLEIPYFLEVQ